MIYVLVDVPTPLEMLSFIYYASIVQFSYLTVLKDKLVLLFHGTYTIMT